MGFEVIFYVFGIVVSTILLISIIVKYKRNTALDIEETLYVFPMPKWKKTLLIIEYVMITACIIAVLYSLFTQGMNAHQQLLMVVFWLLLLLVNLGNLIRSYHLTTKGIIFYGASKKVLKFYFWDQIKDYEINDKSQIIFNVAFGRGYMPIKFKINQQDIGRVTEIIKGLDHLSHNVCFRL